ncbi:hypothetical protein ACFVTF_08365 [Kitasatospora sp. NPDC057940]|uniref:hypothetical protein n=1 Tax=Kitasatospora sp. NPDC057940 TaxID=3346285 RepID=UPI0036DC9013
MYAEREKWPPEAVRVRLGYETNGSRGPTSREAALTGAPADARRARLLDVRDHIPVAPAPWAGAAIDTTEDRV